MSFSIMCSFIVALATSASAGMMVASADMANKMIHWVDGKFFYKKYVLVY